MYQPDPFDPPAIRVLSLGAGVDSTALALVDLLAAEALDLELLENGSAAGCSPFACRDE